MLPVCRTAGVLLSKERLKWVSTSIIFTVSFIDLQRLLGIVKAFPQLLEAG